MKRFLLVLLLLGAPLARATDASSVTLYLQVVCGLDSDAPPTPQAKLVGPKLDQHLHNIFRWKNYWEVRREAVTIKLGDKVRRRVTPQREIEITWPADRKLVVSLYVDGKLTRRREQPIDGPHYIAGGDSNDNESWFVIVRRDNPDAVLPAAPKLADMP